jgi:hypothetical protein
MRRGATHGHRRQKGNEMARRTVGSFSYSSSGRIRLRAHMVVAAVGVGDHKMHIVTANIPTFHSRYRQ